jgi:hypothetical protein
LIIVILFKAKAEASLFDLLGFSSLAFNDIILDRGQLHWVNWILLCQILIMMTVTAYVTEISGVFLWISVTLCETLSIKRILSLFELLFIVMERQCGLWNYLQYPSYGGKGHLWCKWMLYLDSGCNSEYIFAH